MDPLVRKHLCKGTFDFLGAGVEFAELCSAS